MRRLIDSDILIDHLRGRESARDFLTDCLERGDELLCSVITHAELVAGLRSGEESQIRALLSLFEPRPIGIETAQLAGHYRRQFARSHGVELPDALIAAAARLADATLNTKNVKHYPMPDLRVEQPY